MSLKICYHGTDQRAAGGIRWKGFREGTYFARHLEDAIEMGGPYVFAVVFNEAELPPTWQFICRNIIPPDRIVYHRTYAVQDVTVNQDLWDEVLQSNLAIGPEHCDKEE